MKKVVKSLILVAAVMATVGCSEAVKCDDCRAKEEAVKETILTRRSIRDYKEEPVCREVMAEILQCGIYAPSAMTTTGAEAYAAGVANGMSAK